MVRDREDQDLRIAYMPDITLGDTIRGFLARARSPR